MDHPGTELGVSQHGHCRAALGPTGCSEHEMNPPGVEGAQEEPNRPGGGKDDPASSGGTVCGF